MKRTGRDEFDNVQAALLYEMNKPMSLEEYCKTLDYSKADTINFEEWAKKEGFAYDDATKANWDYRYERFEKEETKMFKKKKDSFLDKAQKFLKECYDKGAIIEYEESEGKWVDLPKGLPIDFSKLKDGTIRLKYEEPTYEQVEKFRKAFGNPIVTDTDFRNFPILTFCLFKGFCAIKEGGLLEWNPMSIWRYYNVKEFLSLNPLKKEFDKTDVNTFNGILNYIEMEFQNINAKIDGLYAKTFNIKDTCEVITRITPVWNIKAGEE